jgi:hypothetical protein
MEAAHGHCLTQKKLNPSSLTSLKQTRSQIRAFRSTVSTSSSAQVRQPIFRDGLSQWRHYEPWLSSLKEALGASR